MAQSNSSFVYMMLLVKRPFDVGCIDVIYFVAKVCCTIRRVHTVVCICRDLFERNLGNILFGEFILQMKTRNLPNEVRLASSCIYPVECNELSSTANTNFFLKTPEKKKEAKLKNDNNQKLQDFFHPQVEPRVCRSFHFDFSLTRPFSIIVYNTTSKNATGKK